MLIAQTVFAQLVFPSVLRLAIGQTVSDELVFPSVFRLAIAQTVSGEFGVPSHGIRGKNGACTLSCFSKIRFLILLCPAYTSGGQRHVPR